MARSNTGAAILQGIYTCKEEMAANPARAATANGCKDRDQGELGRQRGRGAPPPTVI